MTAWNCGTMPSAKNAKIAIALEEQCHNPQHLISVCVRAVCVRRNGGEEFPDTRAWMHGNNFWWTKNADDTRHRMPPMPMGRKHMHGRFLRGSSAKSTLLLWFRAAMWDAARSHALTEWTQTMRGTILLRWLQNILTDNKANPSTMAETSNLNTILNLSDNASPQPNIRVVITSDHQPKRIKIKSNAPPITPLTTSTKASLPPFSPRWEFLSLLLLRELAAARAYLSQNIFWTELKTKCREIRECRCHKHLEVTCWQCKNIKRGNGEDCSCYHHTGARADGWMMNVLSSPFGFFATPVMADCENGNRIALQTPGRFSILNMLRSWKQDCHNQSPRYRPVLLRDRLLPVT